MIGREIFGGEVEGEIKLDNDEEEDEADVAVEFVADEDGEELVLPAVPSVPRGARALAIALMIRLLVVECEMLVPLTPIALPITAEDEEDLLMFKSTCSGLTIMALCMTWRYAAPRRDLRSSSSESVIAKYA